MAKVCDEIMSHLSDGETIIKSIHNTNYGQPPSLNITNYGNILCKFESQPNARITVHACNKNRPIHPSIIPIIVEHDFKSTTDYNLQIELLDLLNLTSKVLTNVGIDISDPSIDEVYKAKSKIISEWCKEMSKDRNHFYLVDRIEHGYDFYSMGAKKFQFQAFNNRTFDNFEEQEFDFRSPPHDTIFVDADFKIIAITKEGIKRNKRIELNKAIHDSIDTNQFVYCEI